MIERLKTNLVKLQSVCNQLKAEIDELKRKGSISVDRKKSSIDVEDQLGAAASLDASDEGDASPLNKPDTPGLEMEVAKEEVVASPVSVF